jgi:hypothetical protein
MSATLAGRWPEFCSVADKTNQATAEGMKLLTEYLERAR